jgi:NAD(P)-dependent dehydrogenase (short-subunit alcohol dehydrogenase family)
VIIAAGGDAVAVRVDHTADGEVEALFARVAQEHGRVDVLADSVAGEDPLQGEWGSFWDIDVSRGEAIHRQAVLSRVIAARHAARLMMPRKRGLIVEITEGDTLGSGGNVLTQLARISHKTLVTILAGELSPHGVAAVALTPGFLRSERMLENFGVTEANWREGGAKDPNFLESESPLYVGRAVAALAGAPDLMARSGHLFSSWGLARELGFTDGDGRRPDWGALEVDFSTLPPSLCKTILEGFEFQRSWLDLLSKRNAHYLESWGPGLRERSKA